LLAQDKPMEVTVSALQLKPTDPSTRLRLRLRLRRHKSLGRDDNEVAARAEWVGGKFEIRNPK